MRLNASSAAIIAAFSLFPVATSAANATPLSTFTLRGFGAQANCTMGHVQVEYPSHHLSLTSVKRLNATECQVTGTIDASPDSIAASDRGPSGFAPASFTFSIDNVVEPSIVDALDAIATPPPAPTPQRTINPSWLNPGNQFAPIVVVTDKPTADPGSSSGSGTGKGAGTDPGQGCKGNNINPNALGACGGDAFGKHNDGSSSGSSGITSSSNSGTKQSGMIGVDKAQAIALAALPGTLDGPGNLQAYPGLNEPVYIFTIKAKSDGGFHFVNVDSVTGKVVKIN